MLVVAYSPIMAACSVFVFVLPPSGCRCGVSACDELALRMHPLAYSFDMLIGSVDKRFVPLCGFRAAFVACAPRCPLCELNCIWPVSAQISSTNVKLILLRIVNL